MKIFDFDKHTITHTREIPGRGAERQNHQHNDVGRLMEEEEEDMVKLFILF